MVAQKLTYTLINFSDPITVMSNRSFHTARGSNSNNNSNSNSNLTEENVANLQAFPHISASELTTIQRAEDTMMYYESIVRRLDVILDGLYENITALAELRKRNKSRELRDEYNRFVDEYMEIRAAWLHYSEQLDVATAQFQATQMFGGRRKKHLLKAKKKY